MSTSRGAAVSVGDSAGRNGTDATAAADRRPEATPRSGRGRRHRRPQATASGSTATLGPVARSVPPPAHALSDRDERAGQTESPDRRTARGRRLIRAATSSTGHRAGGRGGGRRSGRPSADVRDEPVARSADALVPGEARPRPRTAGRAAVRRPRSARPPSGCAPGAGTGRGSAPAGRCRGWRSTRSSAMDRRRTGSRRRRSGRTGSSGRGRVPRLISDHLQLRAAAWRSSGSRSGRSGRPSRTTRSAGGGRRLPGLIVPCRRAGPTSARRLGRWMKNARPRLIA